MSPYLQTDKCWPWTTLLADVTRGSLLPEALQWEIRMEMDRSVQLCAWREIEKGALAGKARWAV